MNGALYKEVETTWQDSKFDFQTPPEVCNYMASMVPGWAKTILEPTPGRGNLALACRDRGLEVISPDNYFTLDPELRVDAVVMNPPFSHKFTNLEGAPVEVHKSGMRMGYWFLTDCTRRSDIVIALMPWFTISDSDVRMRSLKRFGMRSITALPRKTFQFARIQTMVLHLERGYSGKTEFIAYDCLKDHEQGNAFNQA
jgi:type I restriction-modification system DNA methylase subunit